MPSPESPSRDATPSLEDDSRETKEEGACGGDSRTTDKKREKSKPTSAGDDGTHKPADILEQQGSSTDPTAQPSASALPTGDDVRPTARDNEQSRASSGAASLQDEDSDSSPPPLVSDTELEETQQLIDHNVPGAVGTHSDTGTTSGEKERPEEHQSDDKSKENVKSDNALKRNSLGESEGSPSKKNRPGMLESILRGGGASVGYSLGIGGHQGLLSSTDSAVYGQGATAAPSGTGVGLQHLQDQGAVGVSTFSSGSVHVSDGLQPCTNVGAPPHEHPSGLLDATSNTTPGTPVDEMAKLMVDESTDKPRAESEGSSLPGPAQVDEDSKSKQRGDMVQNLFQRLAQKTTGSHSFTGSGTGTATAVGEASGTGVQHTWVSAGHSHSLAGLQPGSSSASGATSSGIGHSQAPQNPMMSQLLGDSLQPTVSSNDSPDPPRPQPALSRDYDTGKAKNKAGRSKGKNTKQKNRGGPADVDVRHKRDDDNDDTPPPASGQQLHS